jgi:hypothetical protein
MLGMMEDTANMAPTTGTTMISREQPNPEASRAALVKSWQDRVLRAKAFWRPAFERMREDQKFAAGYQWPGQTENDDRYVANVILRHIQQRVAVVYGKNPKVIARRRERLQSSVWDGSIPTIQAALQRIAMGQVMPDDVMLLSEAQRVMAERKMLDNVGKTLELVYNYNIDEQVHPFKPAMKNMVRRTLTTGVGYVKVGYQRVMAPRPETERNIADISERLAHLERLAADIADGEVEPNSGDMEALRLQLESLRTEPQSLVREGLVFDYPDSTSIIPDPQCKQLRGFIGCGWVVEEFMLTADAIKETYKVDVKAGGHATTYHQLNDFSEPVPEMFSRDQDNTKAPQTLFRVWEIYSRKDGLVYTVCEGYGDFLIEPAAPDVWLERFWPWFTFATNEVYYPNCVIPLSDVRLMRDMQLELNRARQGLREHRRANRPKYIVPSGALDDEDMEVLKNHPANAIIELNALQPGQAVDTVLQALKTNPIDPALYDTNPAFEDILRVVGVQEANLGGTAGATATESSIAESSRMSALSSTVDDLDEMLTEIARAAGQILMENTSTETVVEIVGQGAVWPEFNREQIAKEIYLEVEAASTGRPNKAAEVQNATQLMPILMQLPGISPEWIARELIRRMDDRLDLTDAFAAGLPSIASMNRGGALGGPAGPAGQAGQNSPDQQGGRGQDNAPSTEPKQNNAGPRPQIAGQNNPMSPTPVSGV